MSMDQDSIAEVIQKELSDDEKQLMEMQKSIQQLSSRVNANRAWLDAHGYPSDGRPADIISKDSTSAPEELSDGTVKGGTVTLIKMHGPMTISQIHELLLAAGKNIKRVTVDQAVRDDRYFELNKKDGRVIVSIKK